MKSKIFYSTVLMVALIGIISTTTYAADLIIDIAYPL